MDKITKISYWLFNKIINIQNMNTTLKRYIISTLETAGVTFLAVLFLQIEPIIIKWAFPTIEIIVSAIMAWYIAFCKVVFKWIREYLFFKQSESATLSESTTPKEN